MITNKFEFWSMNNPVRRGMLRFEAKKLRKMSPAKKLEKVLEIGCGEGQSTKNIVRYFKPKFIDAIDLDPKMIVRAKRGFKGENVTFKVGDASNLSDVKDNTYDAVFDFAIIHHIPNWQDCLQEMYRVLKPGGYVHIEDLSIESFHQPVIGTILHRLFDHPYDKMYTRHNFEKELQSLGFKAVNESDFLVLRPFWKVLKK